MERVASQSRDRSLAHGVTSVASQSLPDAKRLLNIPRIEHSARTYSQVISSPFSNLRAQLTISLSRKLLARLPRRTECRLARRTRLALDLALTRLRSQIQT